MFPGTWEKLKMCLLWKSYGMLNTNEGNVVLKLQLQYFGELSVGITDILRRITLLWGAVMYMVRE